MGAIATFLGLRDGVTMGALSMFCLFFLFMFVGVALANKVVVVVEPEVTYTSLVDPGPCLCARTLAGNATLELIGRMIGSGAGIKVGDAVVVLAVVVEALEVVEVFVVVLEVVALVVVACLLPRLCSSIIAAITYAELRFSTRFFSLRRYFGQINTTLTWDRQRLAYCDQEEERSRELTNHFTNPHTWVQYTCNEQMLCSELGGVLWRFESFLVVSLDESFLFNIL
jgi:hypothetical protein